MKEDTHELERQCELSLDQPFTIDGEPDVFFVPTNFFVQFGRDDNEAPVLRLHLNKVSGTPTQQQKPTASTVSEAVRPVVVASQFCNAKEFFAKAKLVRSTL